MSRREDQDAAGSLSYVCPVTRVPLRWDGERYRGREGGPAYRRAGGIDVLLDPDQAEASRDSDGFYDRHPFGRIDWDDEGAAEAALDGELDTLLQSLPRTIRVLDAGSGAGRLSIPLVRRGYDTVSLDRSASSLALIRRYRGTRCVQGDVLAMPFADGTFDLVLCTGILHHTVDPYRGLAECARVVRQGGVLYLRTYNAASLYRWLYQGPGRVLRGLEGLGRIGRPAAELLGWQPYRLVQRVVPRRGRRPDDAILRGKYENLLLKGQVTFLREATLVQALQTHGLTVCSHRRRGRIQANLCVVARKEVG